MNKEMSTGIILICIGVILMALFGALGNYYIQKGRSKSAVENQKIILEKISDSKKEILKSSASIHKEPTLSINSKNGIEIKDTTSGPYFWLCLESLNAGSTNFELDCFILAEYKNGSTKLHPTELIPKNSEILTKAYRGLIPFDENIISLYLYINGTYSNLSQSANYKIDKLYNYRHEEGITYQRVGTDQEKVLGVIENLSKK
ncbi:hypothetical protein [Flagellimonas sp. S3867]|uniref:hypothetical protein n=1 Tax=Flagellimonas sp. S3867 TaxID=2768063 RepID=UPI0016889AA3|nr:hypothetical protein [Flagellimonas sp. S3867]